MQVVPQSFHDKARSGVRSHKWGVNVSFDKARNTNIGFFQLDYSQLNLGDILSPTADNPVQFWDYYQYVPYAGRVVDMEWSREIEFPYSVTSAMADFTLNNYDGYFTPDTSTRVVLATNRSKNPSLELSTGVQVEVRRNLTPNPTFRTNIAGWSKGATLSDPTYFASSNIPSGRFVKFSTVGAGVGAETTPFFGPSGIEDPGVYTITGYVWHNHSTALEFCLRMNQTSQDSKMVQPNTWTKISATLDYDTLVDSNTGIRCVDAVPAGVDINYSSFLTEQMPVELPYFDGVVNDGFDPSSLTSSWTGTPNDSASILTGEEAMGAVIWPFSNPMWLSSDGVNHGARFARALVKQTSSNIVTYAFNDVEGIIAGETQTNSAFVRASAPYTAEVRWQTQTGTGGGSTVAGNHNITTSWTEAKFTGQSTFNNSPLSFYVEDPAVGTLLDMDNHYAIVGTYEGSYFDGNSGIDYAWRGDSNNSVSMKYEPMTSIGRYVLPKRPVRLYSGFEGETLLQQFVGLTEGMPVIDSNSRTAQFHAMDFLAEMFTMPINRLIAMSNVTTDEVLAAMFDQFGLDPTQYSLAPGNNRIPFVFFPKGKSTREALKEVMQAEGGQLWIDEQGIIRFSPRIVNNDPPVLTYDNSSTETITLSGDEQIINTVRVTSDIRAVQPYQRVYASTDPETGSSAFTEPQTISAGGTRFIEVSLDDPLISVVTPTNGRSLTDSWFTALDADDELVTGGISITLTRLNVNSYVMLFSNSNGFPVTIDNVEIWGEPAKVVDTIRYTARDTDSVDRYGEKVLEIENDMFGSEANAESFALTILNAYSEFNGTIEIEGKGNPALQLGDVISVETREVEGQFKVVAINTSMSGSKVTSRVKAIRVKYEGGQWFMLNESVMDGPSVLAP